MESIPSKILENTEYTKLIILLEERALSDVFEPIALTHEQVIKVLDLLQTFMVHDAPNAFQVVTNSAHRITIPNVPDSYSQEQIDEMRKNAPPETF